ncbi:MAG: hypothetical protein GC157_12040 [Frankiales bacterium]|nr:hypothetical protein [Frankiales bacterium]
MSRAARRLTAVLVAVLAAIGLAVLPAGPASAHAYVLSSTPGDGQRVETSPREVTLTLSENGDPESVVASLVGPAGPVATLGAAYVKGADPQGHQVLAIPVGSTLDAGLYRLSFQVTSTFDGHTTESWLLFGVRTDVASPIGVDNAVSTNALSDTLRGAFEGTLLIAAGIAFGLLVLTPLSAGRGRRTARVAGTVAVVAALAVGAEWHNGNGLLVASCGVVGAALLTLLATRPGLGGRARLAAACLGLVLAVAPLGLVGHAAAQGPLMTVVAVLHMVSTAAWVGTVVAGAIVTRGVAREERREVLRRTSLVGTSTFLVALITGLLMGNAMVPSLGGLTGSTYGQALVVKTLLVLGVLALALLSRERLRFGRTTPMLPEAVVLVAVAVIGVFVATQAPPLSARYQPLPSTWSVDTAPSATQVDDLLVSASIDPNTPGTRFLVVRVDNVRRPAPAPVTAVSAAVGDGDLVPLTRGEDGQWTTSVSVPAAGPLSLTAVVSRPGMPDAVADTTWTVGPTPGEYAGGSPLTLYVAGAIAGLLGAWLLLLLVEGYLRPRESETAVGADELAEQLTV